MVLNVPLFAGLAWAIGRRYKPAFYLALLFLAVHLVLTVTDQFGLLDVVVLVIDAATVVLLLLGRRAWTNAPSPAPSGPEEVADP